MAQVAKIDVAQAGEMGVKLPHVAGTEQMVVPASKLHYADPQAWKINGETAEFLGGDPTVDGTYGVKNLELGKMYEVSFYMSIKHKVVSNPVTLTLEYPTGKKEEKTETVVLCPHVWQEVSVGKFLNVYPFGDIKFTFSGASGDTWKGLLLQGVHIISFS